MQPHLLADRPNEACKFACDRSDDYGWLLASGDHGAISRAESGLCLPGNVADVLRQLYKDLGLLLRDACRVLVAPCSFDQHPPGFAVASLGDTSASDRSSAGVLRGDKTEIAHQQAR